MLKVPILWVLLDVFVLAKPKWSVWAKVRNDERKPEKTIENEPRAELAESNKSKIASRERCRVESN